MGEKLKWAWRLLRSRTFIVLTDTAAVVNLPIVSIDSLENQYILGGQTSALQEFKNRLEALIGEHEQAIALLAYRERRKQDRESGEESPPTTQRHVRKTTKTRKP